jgi:NlpC/P60 family protein
MPAAGRVAVIITLLAALLGAASITQAPAASAAVGYGGSRAGNAALNWAEAHAKGCWYYYGGSGCSPGYDCSGLVMEAFAHAAGISLPHSTYQMVHNPHLHWIPLPQVRRGDLLFFYGDGHVELATIWWHTTFGAHDWGQRVGWLYWGSSWYNTPVAYRVW